MIQMTAGAAYPYFLKMFDSDVYNTEVIYINIFI